MRRAVNGILLLDKPKGFTSNKVLQVVKNLFYAKKAGHTGSLDPLATGMLPICFGEATKFSQYLLDSDKAYAVVAKLGERTTTGDSEGEVIASHPVHVDILSLEKVIKQFIGQIEQIPPMFSALKVQGKPLYELARRGIEIERKPRHVTIFSLILENFTNDIFSFHVHCSKGTYVRTLVEDMGHQLGCGAHVIGLRRTSVSPYGNAKMYTLDELEEILQQQEMVGLTSCLLPPETSVQTFPAITLSTSAVFYLRKGQSIRASFPLNATLVRLLSQDGKFIGMGEILPDGRIKPHRLNTG